MKANTRSNSCILALLLLLLVACTHTPISQVRNPDAIEGSDDRASVLDAFRSRMFLVVDENFRAEQIDEIPNQLALVAGQNSALAAFTSILGQNFSTSDGTSIQPIALANVLIQSQNFLARLNSNALSATDRELKEAITLSNNLSAQTLMSLAPKVNHPESPEAKAFVDFLVAGRHIASGDASVVEAKDHAARAQAMLNLLRSGEAPTAEQAFASTEDLELNEQTSPYSPGIVSNVLSDVPGLRKYILQMMDDPDFPASMKQVIKKSLQDQPLRVVNLTEELRQRWKVADTVAFARAEMNHVQVWRYKNASPTANDIPIEHDLDNEAAIVSPDISLTEADYNLVAFVHEIAHIRFDTYVDQHFDQICERLPSSLVRKSRSGAWMMSSQLFDLLTEKYAHEMEYKTLQTIYPKYLSKWPARWPQLKGTPAQISAWIGKDIVNHYNITDPQVVALAELRVSEILRSGLPMTEMNEALHVYSTPETERPQVEELPLATEILRLFAESLGQPVSKTADISKAYSYLKKLVAVDKKAERTNDLISKLMELAEERQESRNAFIRFFGDPRVRTLLNRKADWNLPTGELSWKSVIQAHPIVRILFNPNPFPVEADSGEILTLLHNGFQEGSFTIARAEEAASFRQAYEDALRIQSLAENYMQEAPTIRKPIWEALRKKNTTLNDFTLKNYLNGFWSRLGLLPQYLAEFKNSDSFLQAKESLLDIYLRLKQKAGAR
jgi:hypothetical protein